MQICIKVGGVRHCYGIPIFTFPINLHIPGPGPVNYPQLFQDGMLVASLQSAAEQVSDSGVREALAQGVAAATQALQKRAGEHVTVEAGRANRCALSAARVRE